MFLGCRQHDDDYDAASAAAESDAADTADASAAASDASADASAAAPKTTGSLFSGKSREGTLDC